MRCPRVLGVVEAIADVLVVAVRRDLAVAVEALLLESDLRPAAGVGVAGVGEDD